MRAVVLREFGPAENLSYEAVPDPVPGEGQVRVVVHAAGVHLIETKVRAGYTGGPPLPELPVVFGSEVAGVVDAVGAGVDESWIGTNVVAAETSPGGYAELVVVDVSAVRTVPNGVDHRTAAAMIRTGATTVGMLDIAELTSDDVVLVTSAAGGIGRLLVQHAHRLGATVVGAAGGPAKAAAVRELGADVAVDYNQPDWAAAVRAGLDGRRVTVVLDGVGGDIAATAYNLLDSAGGAGRFVTIGVGSGEPFVPPGGDGPTFTSALMQLINRPEALPDHERRALEAAAAGSFVPAFQVFPLSEVVTAHRDLEDRRTSGKVILEP